MTKNYSQTIHKPYTKFSMQAKLASSLEDRILKKWKDKKIYEKMKEKSKDAPVFRLIDGPPYANGAIHIGHALNKILKSIITQSQRFNGMNCQFIPGFDCHGLPIEAKVEKEKSSLKKDNPKAFRARCREYAQEQIAIQTEGVVRMGVLGEWDSPYKTMSFEMESQSVAACADFYRLGYLKPGFKPVHWCVRCQSSLAQAELEYEDVTSLAVDVLFQITLPENHNFLTILKKEKESAVYAVVWTTTPWTLPANQAVCVKNDLNYSLVQEPSGKWLLIATDLIKELSTKWSQNLVEYASCSGDSLIGSSLKHPFENRSVPLLLGNHVTKDQGTGLVHTAPSHGPEDFFVCREHNIEPNVLIDEKGVFHQNHRPWRYFIS